MLRQMSLGRPDLAAGWLSAILQMLSEDMEQLEESGSASRHQQRIQELCLSISEEPEASYRIEDMAKACYLSPDHFSRLFKKQMGMSPKAYIINSRIQAAKGLLLSSGYSIEEIADQCGFQNVFYFSRLFKKKTGLPPSSFR